MNECENTHKKEALVVIGLVLAVVTISFSGIFDTQAPIQPTAELIATIDSVESTINPILIPDSALRIDVENPPIIVEPMPLIMYRLYGPY